MVYFSRKFAITFTLSCYFFYGKKRTSPEFRFFSVLIMSLSHNLPDYWSSHVKANVKHYTTKKDRPGTVIAGCPANYGLFLDICLVYLPFQKNVTAFENNNYKE